MKLQSTALDPRPLRPDFLNSLSQELTWALSVSFTPG
jgi:hypothetical protein